MWRVEASRKICQVQIEGQDENVPGSHLLHVQEQKNHGMERGDRVANRAIPTRPGKASGHQTKKLQEKFACYHANGGRKTPRFRGATHPSGVASAASILWLHMPVLPTEKETDTGPRQSHQARRHRPHLEHSTALSLMQQQQRRKGDRLP